MNKLTLLSIASIGVLLSACTTEQLPIGASLRITPDIRTLLIDAPDDPSEDCRFDPNRYLDVPLNITLTDAQDAPIGNAEIGVYVDFAGNTYSGSETLQLFQDKNGNGVVDAATELVSDFNSDIFRTNTDRWHGNALLLLRINLSCTYRASVFAFAGAVTGSANIEVAYDPEDVQEETTTSTDTMIEEQVSDSTDIEVTETDTDTPTGTESDDGGNTIVDDETDEDIETIGGQAIR